MDQRANTLLVQGGLDSVPRQGPYNKQMPNRFGSGGHFWQKNPRQIAQGFSVDTRNLASAGVLGIEARKLGGKDAGLQFVQAGIDSPLMMNILGGGTVVPETAHTLSDGRIIGGNGPAVTQGAEILGRIKTKSSGDAKTSGALPVEAGTMCLSRILDEKNPSVARYIHEVVNWGNLTVQMNGKNGSRTWGYCVGDSCRVNIVRLQIDIDRHDRRAALTDGEPGSDERVSGDDNFAARSYTESPQYKNQGIEAISHANRVFHTAIAGEGGFKVFQILSQNGLSTVQHPGNRTFNRRPELGMQPAQTHEWHFSHWSRPRDRAALERT